MLNSERGIVLISSLIILIIISIIAIAVGQSSVRNQQMGSARADQLRGQALATSSMNKADADFRNAIVYNPANLVPSGATNLVTTMDTNGWWLIDSNWSNAGVHSFTELNNAAGGEPRYRLEYREKIQVNSNIEEKITRSMYRTTTRGNGPGEDTRSIMQAYFIFNSAE